MSVIHGTPGDDTIKGTPQKDVIFGYDGDDTLSGKGGDDIVHGGPGHDLIRGDEGDDFLYGERGDDLIVGGPGDDRLLGGEGNDVLIGGPGNDRVQGGMGRNLYVWSVGDGVDTIQDQAGLGALLLQGITSDQIRLERCDRQSFNIFYHDELILQIQGIQTIQAEDGRFLLYHWNHRIQGTPQDDTLIGTSHDDLIQGFGGNDLIRGEAGDDILMGGPGDDWLEGGPGNDQIHSGEGDDVVRGGPGDDKLYGGRGRTTYIYAVGDGYDTIRDEGKGSKLLLQDIASTDVTIQAIEGGLAFKVFYRGEPIVLMKGVDLIQTTDGCFDLSYWS